MDLAGDGDIRAKEACVENSELPSRERIAQGSRLRESAEPSPRQRTTAAMSRDKSDGGGKDNGLEYEVREYGQENEDERSDNGQESNDESDPGGAKYTNVNYPDRKNSKGQIRKKSTDSHAAFKTAMLEAESAVASSKDALKTVSAAYGSPLSIPQTATVQPLQQLQQQPQPTMFGNVIRTSTSSPSPSSSASSSAAPTQLGTLTASTIHSSSSANSAVKTSDNVRTLYACVGEHESELSFEPNQIITGVRPSLEPGWLEGCLDGKIGLVPENYVEFVA